MIELTETVDSRPLATASIRCPHCRQEISFFPDLVSPDYLGLLVLFHTRAECC